MRITTVYERITVHAERTFICAQCDRRARRSTTFGQTLNPFNKNAQGEIRTRAEIETELRAQAATWNPTMHERCEHLTLPPALQ